MLRRAITRLSRQTSGRSIRAASGAESADVAKEADKPVYGSDMNQHYFMPYFDHHPHVDATYRELYTPSNRIQYAATLFGTILWTWILLGLFYEPEAITGHHPWPDVTEWTDKELGIPDDLNLADLESELES